MQYKAKINKELMTELGITVEALKTHLAILYDELPITKSRDEKDEIEIILKISDQDKKIENILASKILTDNNQFVPISSFVSFEKILVRNAIYHNEGKKSIKVFADINEDLITSYEINKKIVPFLAELSNKYPDMVITTGGEEEERIEAFQDVIKLYLIAIIAIFMIISINLNSAILPFLVILVIPFGFTGIVWALFLHNTPLTMMGTIGAFGLSGVAVNGAIILIKSILDELPHRNNNCLLYTSDAADES